MILLDIIKLKLRHRRETTALEGWISMSAAVSTIDVAIDIARREVLRHVGKEGPNSQPAYAASLAIEFELINYRDEMMDRMEGYHRRLIELRAAR